MIIIKKYRPRDSWYMILPMEPNLRNGELYMIPLTELMKSTSPRVLRARRVVITVQSDEEILYYRPAEKFIRVLLFVAVLSTSCLSARAKVFLQ